MYERAHCLARWKRTGVPNCSNDPVVDFLEVSEQEHSVHILEGGEVVHLLQLCLACDGDPVPIPPKPAHGESRISIQCTPEKLP